MTDMKKTVKKINENPDSFQHFFGGDEMEKFKKIAKEVHQEQSKPSKSIYNFITKWVWFNKMKIYLYKYILTVKFKMKNLRRKK